MKKLMIIVCLGILSGCSIIQNDLDSSKLVGFGFHIWDPYETDIQNISLETENFTYFMVDWEKASDIDSPNTDVITTDDDSGIFDTSVWSYYEDDKLSKFSISASLNVNYEGHELLFSDIYFIFEDDKGVITLKKESNFNAGITINGVSNTVSYTFDNLTYEFNFIVRTLYPLERLEIVEYDSQGEMIQKSNLMNVTSYEIVGDYVVIVEDRPQQELKRTLYNRNEVLSYQYGLPQNNEVIVKRNTLFLIWK